MGRYLCLCWIPCLCVVCALAHVVGRGGKEGVEYMNLAHDQYSASYRFGSVGGLCFVLCVLFGGYLYGWFVCVATLAGGSGLGWWGWRGVVVLEQQ